MKITLYPLLKDFSHKDSLREAVIYEDSGLYPSLLTEYGMIKLPNSQTLKQVAHGKKGKRGSKIYT